MVTFSLNGGNGGSSALSVRSLINNRALSKTRRALLGSALLLIRLRTDRALLPPLPPFNENVTMGDLTRPLT